MANIFKSVNYGKMLYETLRNYYSVNSSGELSILYKYMACFVAPMQGPFDQMDIDRIKARLIAQCEWQIGQLTNVLNYLYDTTLKRIYIGQSTVLPVSSTTFAYTAIINSFVFNEISSAGGLQMRVFGDKSTVTLVAINVPSSVNIPEITATINQIRLQGIPYQ